MTSNVKSRRVAIIQLLPAAGSRRVFFLALFTLAAALGGLSSLALYFADLTTRDQLSLQLEQRETLTVNAMQREVQERVFGITADLIFMQMLVERQLEIGRDWADLVPAFMDFADSHRSYFQLRYLDATGREIIRVDNIDSSTLLTTGDALQDKSDSDYVREGLSLQRDDVLISRLDANREFGRIELPVKPVIRFLTPVFGPDGARAGLVIINFRAALLLKSVETIGAAALGRPFLASEAGRSALEDFLSNEAGAIAIDGSQQRSFALRYPQAWAKIKLAPAASFIDASGGLITYVTFKPSALSPPNGFVTSARWTVVSERASADVAAGWFVGSFVEPAALATALSLTESRAKPALLLFALLILAFSWLFALRVAGLRMIAKNLRVEASRDYLTGLLNRGEFERRLQAALSHAERFHRPMAILYIDLNEFKTINDTLGHAAGDDLLKHVALTLEASTRRSDVVARLGGDEFAVLLGEITSRADARNVADYLRKQLDAPTVIAGKKVVAGGSIGTATYPEDGITAEALLEKADRSMFKEKKLRAA